MPSVRVSPKDFLKFMVAGASVVALGRLAYIGKLFNERSLSSNGSNLVFDHWQDTGSTNHTRSVSITDDTLLVAVYRNS